MLRILTIAALTLALASPALSDTAQPPKKKHAAARHVKHWTVPPGYRTPAQIEREEYGDYRRDRAFAWRHNLPRAYYYYYGGPYYTGHLGGNYRDSLHVGPCWTQTPIGAIWNCGR